MILILSIILKFGKSKDKTFFYLNKLSRPFKLEYLPSWPSQKFFKKSNSNEFSKCNTTNTN